MIDIKIISDFDIIAIVTIKIRLDFAVFAYLFDYFF